MKSFNLDCEKCGKETKVKAQDEESLVSWYHLQKKRGNDILCKSCRRKK